MLQGGGWRHVIQECSTLGNVNWEELNQVKPPTRVVDRPGVESSQRRNKK